LRQGFIESYEAIRKLGGGPTTAYRVINMVEAQKAENLTITNN